MLKPQTLFNLNPAVGDTVLYHSDGYTTEYRLLFKPSDTEWVLANAKNDYRWQCGTESSYPFQCRWTLKPKEKPVTVVHCQNPRYTLAQLNPKKGNKVCWHQPEKVVEYEVVRADGEGHWFLRLPNGEGYWFPNCSVPYDLACWTNKPQPKESKVTVADLNLTVGDRIRSGDRTGTCVGWHNYVLRQNDRLQVVWDWGPSTYHLPLEEVDWQLLPKPEPTLASLGLKAGDPVLVGKAVLLVGEVDDEVLTFTNHLGSPISYQLVMPLSKMTRIQKLEVPK